jgi:hypothetical protein
VIAVAVTRSGGRIVVEPTAVGFDDQLLPAPEEVDLVGLRANA